jgi:hypothetical protein
MLLAAIACAAVGRDPGTLNPFRRELDTLAGRLAEPEAAKAFLASGADALADVFKLSQEDALRAYMRAVAVGAALRLKHAAGHGALAVFFAAPSEA